MNAIIAPALPKPTTSQDQIKADLATHGYAIIKDLLSPEQVRVLRDRLDEQARMEREQEVAWLGNGGRGGNTWVGKPRDGDAAPWQCVRTLLNKGRPFIDLTMDATINACMAHIFNGLPYYLSSTNGLILRKGAQPMVTHTDQQYVPLATPFPVVANVMITLSDFTEEMGATRVVPGSHRRPPPPVAIDEAAQDLVNTIDIESVPAVCGAGCAIVFEGRLWHSSGAHSAEATRYSISTYYCMSFMRPQDLYGASMHDDVYDSLTDEERSMFGFRTGPMGRIDPRFPGDRCSIDIPAPYIPELRPGSEKTALPPKEGVVWGARRHTVDAQAFQQPEADKA